MLKKKEKKVTMLINYNKLNDNTVLDDYYTSNKTTLFNRIKESPGSRKWITKVDISI